MAIPNPLVLTLTTIQGSGSCPDAIASQLSNGNPFNIAFDTSQAPPAPGKNGLVFLETAPQNNFTAASRVQLSNEGLSDKLGFMSTSSTQAQIYGQPYTVTRIFLLGTPDGSGGFTWFTGIMIGACVITSGAADADVLAKLQG
jgi:hypothetical protein